jgi:hypothetical protein
MEVSRFYCHVRQVQVFFLESYHNLINVNNNKNMLTLCLRLFYNYEAVKYLKRDGTIG